MITTVFCAADRPSMAWRAELLEYSWRRYAQPGELVRLMPGGWTQAAGQSRVARVVETVVWNPHPYMDDGYPGYELPGAVMEWLLGDAVEGTVLLVDASSVFVGSITHEVEPGSVVASPWEALPRGEGTPFGLGRELRALSRYCVNRELPVPPVRLPLLIDAGDLRRLAARWLELTGIIRAECQNVHGKLSDADRIAYAVAAAEHRLQHRTAALVDDTTGSGDTPLLGFEPPVETPRGEILWDAEVYVPWDVPEPERARPGAGRELLALLAEFASLRESGEGLDLVRPRPCPGVREARMLDELHLEIPGRPENARLNPSASAIWELCDGERTLRDIAAELEARFDAPGETISDAVRVTARELEAAGALELEALF